MQRVLLLTMMIMFFLLSVNTPVYAIDRYVHGDFANNTDSCARCHVTHSAESAYLLSDPNDRTRMCLACHGYMSIMSQYDVYSGITTGTDGVARPSPAGGFTQSADPYSDWTDDTTAMFNPNTSSHHIQSNDAPGLEEGQIDGDIPGGSTELTGSLTCTSCHDPHAGGKYPPDPGQPYRNPRLLKKRPVDMGVDKFVYMKIDYDYGPGYAWLATPEGAGHTSQTMEYGRGFNEWCGTCHDLFNTESTGSEDPNRTANYGIDNGAGQHKYRHKMGVLVTSTTHPGFATSIQDGIPLSTDTTGERDDPTTSTDRISCITCHRTHGSSVNVSYGFARFKSYQTYYRDGSGNLISVDTVNAGDDGASALLRLPQRDVCFKCHGAAQYNKFAGTGNYGKGY